LFLSIVEEGVDLATVGNVPMGNFILTINMWLEPIEGHSGSIFQGNVLLTLELRNLRAETIRGLGPVGGVIHMCLSISIIFRSQSLVKCSFPSVMQIRCLSLLRR
jgi:hypothetical protein